MRKTRDWTERNPLQFEDVALAALYRWAIAEKSALAYFRNNFATPQDALRDLETNPTPPDKFWESL